jgi:hypothetical protein
MNGKDRPDGGRVDVAGDCLYRRPEAAEEVEDSDIDEVPGVEDRVRLAAEFEA